MKQVPPVQELQRICFRSPPDIYRRISIYFTRLALLFGVRANHITISRAIFLILGILVFTFSTITLPWIILGVICFQFVLFLDTMDGAIARYNKEASFFGEALDFILDHISSTVVYFVMAGVLCLRLFHTPHLFWISVITAGLAQFAAFARALYAEHRIDTTHFKQENVALAFFHQDNMRLLLLGLSVAVLLHFYTAYALPVLVIIYFQFIVLKIIFLFGFLWYAANRFPITRHILSAYVLCLFFVIFRSEKLMKKLRTEYADSIVAHAVLRLRV